MNTYICDSHRPAQAENLSEASIMFALRKARREFGRSAKMIIMSARSEDCGKTGEFEAFIGHSIRYTNTVSASGYNVRFSVYRVGYEAK